MNFKGCSLYKIKRLKIILKKNTKYVSKIKDY